MQILSNLHYGSLSAFIDFRILKTNLRRFTLSRFLAKTLRVNKIAMKSFSTNLSFGVDFKRKVAPLMYEIIAHDGSHLKS